MYKLIPFTKDYLWGGTQLASRFGKTAPTEIIAETWELSCHQDGASLVCLSDNETLPLPEFIAEHGREILGSNCQKFSNFPMLIKLIDAQQALSIQVHPDDEYALKNEGEYGKTEVWYIVDATPEAYIYYGFKQDTNRQEVEKAIANNTFIELLNKISVKKGEVYFIPSGTVHAIGVGVLIAEVQQNSNTTYRIYDFDRKDANGNKRELHIKQSLDVLNYKKSTRQPDFDGHIAKCDYFTTDKHIVTGCTELIVDEKSFLSLLVVDGDCELENNGNRVTAKLGESWFLPANAGVVKIHGNCTVLTSYLQDAPYRIGVDLGGTNIKVGIVDHNNAIIAKYRTATQSHKGYTVVKDNIVSAIKQIVADYKLDIKSCNQIGIGCPGTISPGDGKVIYSNNLAWENVPLAEDIGCEFNLPVKISNDANCATLGETIAGSAKGFDDVILLTLGTGVGGGVVINGTLFEGNVGGTELGHIVIKQDSEQCTCGRKGCLEAYASATALIRESVKVATSDKGGVLARLMAENDNIMTAKIPFDAALLGDKSAQVIVDRYIIDLGDGIVNIVNIFRPQAVILSGGVCEQGEVLTRPLTEYIQKYAFAGQRIATPMVKIATLKNDAGIIGAANL